MKTYRIPFQILVQQFSEGENADPLFRSWWDTVHATEESKKEYFFPSNKAAVLQGPNSIEKVLD